MFYKTSNPVADAEAYYADMDRLASRMIYTLHIEDVLGTKPVVVDGIAYDAVVNVWFRKIGDDGEIEIEAIEYEKHDGAEIYLANTEAGVACKFIGSVGHKLEQRIEQAIEERAILAAKQTDWTRWKSDMPYED